MEIRTHFATKVESKALETRLLWAIFSGAGAAPFGVRDGGMTFTYDGTPALEAGTYEFDLTVGVKTADDKTFLVSLENVALGDHTAKTPGDGRSWQHTRRRS